jgi:hypothetical protein
MVVDALASILTDGRWLNMDEDAKMALAAEWMEPCWRGVG